MELSSWKVPSHFKYLRRFPPRSNLVILMKYLQVLWGGGKRLKDNCPHMLFFRFILVPKSYFSYSFFLHLSLLKPLSYAKQVHKNSIPLQIWWWQFKFLWGQSPKINWSMAHQLLPNHKCLGASTVIPIAHWLCSCIVMHLGVNLGGARNLHAKWKWVFYFFTPEGHGNGSLPVQR